MCKACHAAGARAPAHAAPPEPIEPATYDIMADLSEAPEAAPAAPGLLTGCPSCGKPLAEDAVLCVRCGYNRSTGKARRVKVSKEGAGLGAAAGTTAKIAIGANPLVWAACGCIGGAVGAAVWAGVSYYGRIEFGWIAVLVGFLAGVGTRAGAGNYAGLLSGVVAVVVALASIAAGKYAAVSLYVKDIASEIDRQFVMDDAAALDHLADDIALAWEQEGRKLTWPDGMDYESATEITDYPRPVQDEVRKQWGAMDPQTRQAFKDAEEAEFEAAMQSISRMAADEGFMASFSPFDLLWAVIGAAAAFGAGSGGSFGDD